MKTIEELNALKADYYALHEKLAALSAEELQQVTGGGAIVPIDSKDPVCPSCLSPVQRMFIDFQIGRDRFECRGCGKQYYHVWEGDYWEIAD